MKGSKDATQHARFRSIFMYATNRNKPIQSVSEIPQAHFDAVAERMASTGRSGSLSNSVDVKAVVTGEGKREE